MKYVIEKGCIFGLATVMSSCCVSTAYANYKHPSDIDLAVGDFECNGDDILSAETVELPLCIGNNPGFVSLTLIIKIGNGLRFDADCPVYTRTKGLSGVHIYDFSDEYNTMVFTITGNDEFVPFSEDGEIAVFRFSPTVNFENGDCHISFLSEFNDHKMEILTANSYDAVFGEECFSIMNSYKKSLDNLDNSNDSLGNDDVSFGDSLSISESGSLPGEDKSVPSDNSDKNAVITTTRKPFKVSLENGDKSNSNSSDSASKKGSSNISSVIAVSFIAVAVIFVSAFMALSAGTKKIRKKGKENNE